MDQIYKIKGLLLDLDGTLINSEKAFFTSFKKIIKEELNINITKEDYKKYELEQNTMLLKWLREENKIPKNILDNDIMQLIYTDYLEEFKRIIEEKEAIENFALLKQLKNLKIKLALITTCRRLYLNILIKNLNLENLFDIIIAREDVQNLKPNPEAYIKGLKHLKLKKEECLAIEDSKRGIDSSISTGLKTIQVSNFTTIKYQDERAIQEESANIVLKKILKIRETNELN